MDDARLDQHLQATSRTFALTIPLLAAPLRREVGLGYLLFRVADTFEDAAAWPRARRVRFLRRFRAALRRGRGGAALAREALAAPPTDHPGTLALLDELPALIAALGGLRPRAAAIVARHGARTAGRMADWTARADAAGRVRLAGLGELRGYCYAVAGIVGEMLTGLFALDLPPGATRGLGGAAVAFGEGLQLVNILKDARDDAAEGRRFLPPGLPWSRVVALARRDLDRAATYVRALRRRGADRGVVAFTALPLLLARANLVHLARRGPGARLSRPEVQAILARLHADLDGGRDPVAGPPPG